MTSVPQSTVSQPAMSAPAAGSEPAGIRPYAGPSTPAPERRPRINVRIIVFILAISAPFLIIVGSAVWSSLTGGISDHGDYKEVDLKLLGSFPFNDQTGKLEDVPEKYRGLDGQRVLLRGFMYGAETAGNRGNKFQFVYDVNKCCFNGPPLVQERVFAYAKQEVPIYYQDTLAEIVGTLHVRLIRNPVSNKVESVFDMQVESAKAVGG